MRWLYLALLSVLLTLGSGPTRANSLTDEVAALNARWDAAINGPDFEALLPMYSDDAELMPPGARPVTGPAAIRDFFAARGTSVRDHHLQVVRVVSFGSYAYVTSRFTALSQRIPGHGDQAARTSTAPILPLTLDKTRPIAYLLPHSCQTFVNSWAGHKIKMPHNPCDSIRRSR